MTELKPVYAVEWYVRDGVPHYEPRSKASATATMPMLWVSEMQARKVSLGLSASKCAAGRNSRRDGRVVRFSLTPIQEPVS